VYHAPESNPHRDRYADLDSRLDRARRLRKRAHAAYLDVAGIPAPDDTKRSPRGHWEVQARRTATLLRRWRALISECETLAHALACMADPSYMESSYV
jgi:hypothetical protein